MGVGESFGAAEVNSRSKLETSLADCYVMWDVHQAGLVIVLLSRITILLKCFYLLFPHFPILYISNHQFGDKWWLQSTLIQSIPVHTTEKNLKEQKNKEREREKKRKNREISNEGHTDTQSPMMHTIPVLPCVQTKKACLLYRLTNTLVLHFSKTMVHCMCTTASHLLSNRHYILFTHHAA